MAATAIHRMTATHEWRPFDRFLTLFRRARQRARDREALAHLDHRDLRDLGVSRDVLAYELSKPFWRG